MPLARLHISDDAWDNLAKTAQSYGWIRHINTVYTPGASTRHIRVFLAVLATLDYNDVRPGSLQATPVWCTGDTARRHHLNLLNVTIEGFVKLAVLHRILPRVKQQLWLNGYAHIDKHDPDTDEGYAWLAADAPPMALAGAVVEAIGLGYLQPVFGFPRAPDNLYRREKHSRYIDMSRLYADT